MHGRTDRSAIPPQQPDRQAGAIEAAHAARHGPDACAPAPRDVPVCARWRGFAVRAMPGPPAEVVACRAARPSAPPEVSDGESSDGALAIGATHGRFQVGRHMRGLAWPSCPRDRNRHKTAARGGLLPLARARLDMRASPTRLSSRRVALRRRGRCQPVTARLWARSRAVARAVRLSNEGWPRHAVAHVRVGVRPAVEPAWIFAGLSALFASFVCAGTGGRSIAAACAWYD